MDKALTYGDKCHVANTEYKYIDSGETVTRRDFTFLCYDLNRVVMKDANGSLYSFSIEEVKLIEPQKLPRHPGLIFKERILDNLDMSITQAADCLNIGRPALSNFINGHACCSQSMARKIAFSTGTTVELWLNFQNKLDIYEAKQLDIKGVKPFKDRHK